MKLYIYILSIMLCCIQKNHAQDDSLHEKINQDMYENFSRAYKTLDYSLFSSIHSKNMIRASGNGGEIKKSKTYLQEYQKRWSIPTKKAVPIDFRLFERITSETLVSDRGIYRIAYQNDKGLTNYSYGQFHVILQLENGYWKILIDYDSDENKTISKQQYDQAFHLSDYKKYWRQNKN